MRAVRRLSSASQQYVACGGIAVDRHLQRFVDSRVLPGTAVSTDRFWNGLGSIVRDLGPRNAELLRKRDTLQRQIDEWYGRPVAERGDQATFLQSIGYLCSDSQPTVTVETANTDAEVATIGGPQLVCPVDNARFLLNAANARWGSLLDALYGTNAVLPAAAPGKGYNSDRGRDVFHEAHAILDDLFPLTDATWDAVTDVSVSGGSLRVSTASGSATLLDGAQFVGHVLGGADGASSFLLRKNSLHAELVLNRTNNTLGHAAGLVDVVLESALSTICDFEDSACAVDTEDKVEAYSNWLGLMQRTLTASLDKNGSRVVRTLAQPREWSTPDGQGTLVLPGQARLLARNVGMHMYSDMALAEDGSAVPEHFVDAIVTAACALHSHQAGRSIYVVKPKMHGPEEVALASELFLRVEQVLGLEPNTIKMGMMDEERRTSLNLAECVHAARQRLFFINTGFLDRTADEIHTAMEGGAVLPKADIKGATWYSGYEESNVATALSSSLVGKGQIGKGMWAEPDNMRAMMAVKGKQIEAGATTAWVPSPVAATLHALHYMRTSVAETQAAMADAQQHGRAARSAAHRKALLTPPLLGERSLAVDEVQAELDNNVQGLLGYVVRWVGQGVGCSKVPDLHDVQLMEDRATLRISSQHIANWLRHGLVTPEQVHETMRRVATLVDAQNAADKTYRPMAPAYDGPEWYAARDLIFNGCETPNGYTEGALTHWRRERKAMDGLAREAPEAAAA